ncbi:TRAP transporter substrate-binding protein [Kerstersia sp.]|uniref:TRAP transporter substrate-binding protein n=1 Tax=Kerstersia sp. TaxID=1930783 RepID=UPI003F8EA41D
MKIRNISKAGTGLSRGAALCAAAMLVWGSTAAQAADIRDQRVKFSYPVAQDNPVGIAVEHYAKLVEQKSDGRIKVTGYPNATLGNEIQAMSSAQGGILEMTVVSTAGAAGNVKELAIFDLPFIFQSPQEADAVIDSEVGQQLLDKFSDKGLVGMCYLDYGFRQVTNSKHPIAKLEDFRDLKIRTLQNRVYIDIFKALGANPLPLPYPETYTALETRAIDGQESSFLVTKSSSYQDIQKYLSETRHVYLPAVVMASKKFWDKLNDDERGVLQSACVETQAFHRDLSRKMEADVVKELTDAGMVFNAISPEEHARMVEVTAPVIQKYKPELGEALVDRTLEIIDQARSKAN